MINPKNCCETCRWWGEGRYECRRRAPECRLPGASSAGARWPIVGAGDWCGDWAAKGDQQHEPPVWTWPTSTTVLEMPNHPEVPKEKRDGDSCPEGIVKSLRTYMAFLRQERMQTHLSVWGTEDERKGRLAILDVVESTMGVLLGAHGIDLRPDAKE